MSGWLSQSNKVKGLSREKKNVNEVRIASKNTGNTRSIANKISSYQNEKDSPNCKDLTNGTVASIRCKLFTYSNIEITLKHRRLFF